MKSLGKITKFIVAIAGTVTTALETQYPSSAHWLPAVTAAITAVLVYVVPNVKPEAVERQPVEPTTGF